MQSATKPRKDTENENNLNKPIFEMPIENAR